MRGNGEQWWGKSYIARIEKGVRTEDLRLIRRTEGRRLKKKTETKPTRISKCLRSYNKRHHGTLNVMRKEEGGRDRENKHRQTIQQNRKKRVRENKTLGSQAVGSAGLDTRK